MATHPPIHFSRFARALKDLGFDRGAISKLHGLKIESMNNSFASKSSFNGYFDTCAIWLQLTFQHSLLHLPIKTTPNQATIHIFSWVCGT